MTDETKAGILTGAWSIGLFIGGLIGGAVGAVIAVTATLLFVGVLYSSWLIQRTERRLARYISHTGRAIEREHAAEFRRKI
jgi:predicted PurR-regulated permease PerM